MRGVVFDLYIICRFCLAPQLFVGNYTLRNALFSYGGILGNTRNILKKTGILLRRTLLEEKLLVLISKKDGFNKAQCRTYLSELLTKPVHNDRRNSDAFCDYRGVGNDELHELHNGQRNALFDSSPGGNDSPERVHQLDK